MFLRLAFALCLLAAPLAAQPLPGADDPAFARPFARALAGDDPTALTGLPLIALTTMLRRAGVPFFAK